MVFKKIKPITPSQRHLVQVNTKKIFNELNNSRKSTLVKNPIKKLSKGLTKNSGRNNYGRITVRHRGGGHKRKYRQIDFKRTFTKAIVKQIEYDPNRTAFIARIEHQAVLTNLNLSKPPTSINAKNTVKNKNEDNNSNLKNLSKPKESYILAPKNLYAGMEIFCDYETSIQIGNSMLLQNIPIGSLIHNISLKPNKHGQYIRAAGTYGQLIQKTQKYARIKLPSGEHRYVPLNCMATLGIVSNEEHMNEQLGKAGRSRWLGRRPAVRGVAMNPVDHPHGGGEGKTGTKRPSVTPWARHTKGKPTRKANKVKLDKKKKSFIIQNRKV
jgi:large subunit ribosomal protein L2